MTVTCLQLRPLWLTVNSFPTPETVKRAIHYEQIVTNKLYRGLLFRQVCHTALGAFGGWRGFAPAVAPELHQARYYLRNSTIFGGERWTCTT